MEPNRMRIPGFLATWCATLFVVGACTDGEGSKQTGGVPPLPSVDGGPAPIPFSDRLGEVVRSAVAPPPISGGTLLVSSDEAFVVASDPERDRVWLLPTANLDEPAPVFVALEPGDEPGRIEEASDGSFFVVLRGAAAVARLDATNHSVTHRFPTCRSPRGLAHDGSSRSLHVACATGELVTLDDRTGEEQRRLRLAPDLRDVVVIGDRLYVSRFRTAEILVLGPLGELLERIPLPSFARHSASVAWRMKKDGAGNLLVVHQLARTEGDPVSVAHGGYTNPCDPLVAGAMTRIDPRTGQTQTAQLPGTVLPVDFVATDAEVLVVSAGKGVFSTNVPVFGFRSFEGRQPPVGEERPAGEFIPPGFCSSPADVEPWVWVPADGRQLVSISALKNGTRIVQTRDPEAIVVGRKLVELPGEPRRDTGHDIFHRETFGAIACASCHPEGMEDSRVWTFDGIGPRRTQDLRGGISGTAPFHWDGDLMDLQHLAREVFTQRMNGRDLTPAHVDALAGWLDALPTTDAMPSGNTDAVARGRALFESEAVGCASCHAGPRLQRLDIVDVGTGGAFKVPSLLGLAGRTPLMHDGCAPSIRDRFGPECGGGDSHGVTSHLSASELDDLVAYLETL